MGEWTGCEGTRVGQQGEREHLHHSAACKSGINFENIITLSDYEFCQITAHPTSLFTYKLISNSHTTCQNPNLV